MSRLALQFAFVGATATLVLAMSGGCSQVLDITPGTLLSEEAGTTVGCDIGKATCTPNDTCGTDLNTDPANCGSCGTICPGDHATATCEGGQCKFTCATGFADCDQSPSNACETELAATPRHCGKCGHDCFGGGCKTSVCQPRAFADTEDLVRQIGLSGTSLLALASWTLTENSTTNGSSKVDLSPPDSFVDQFATGAGKVYASRHVTGNVEVQVVSGPCIYKNPKLLTIAADDTGLFVALSGTPGSVVEVDPTSTCDALVNKPVNIPTGNSPIVSLASDQDYLYWTTADGTLSKFKKDGSTAVLQWVKTSPGAAQVVATDPLYIYWTSNRGLNRVKKLTQCDSESSACVDFFAPDAHGAFALDTQYVYVATAGTAGFFVSLRDPLTGMDKGSIGSTESVVGIAADASSVYVAAGKRVQRVAK